MTDAEREELRKGGLDQDCICTAESEAADRAGDDKAAWEWLAMTEPPAHTFCFLKRGVGHNLFVIWDFLLKMLIKNMVPIG
ncbi:hypothetical protein GCM10023262_14850 [Bartonella pachyuromydis]|uniref:Uncharacterized protein n=1 Tax=Bartonella pachyuromydis TaxID=931097 RepID=A0ABP8VM70_9HYPH